MKHNGYFTFQTIIDIAGACSAIFFVVCMGSLVIIIICKNKLTNKYTKKLDFFVYLSCTTVVVHNRDQAEIFQNTLIERTTKAAFRALDFISKTF